MATTTINLKNWLKLEATDRAARFVPYKENFVTTVDRGDTLYLKAYTVGQYLYYTKNGFVDTNSTTAGSGIVVNVPAKITITNNSDKVMNFIPYRENFQVEVAPKDAYVFEVETAGQVLYYMSQDTNDISIDNADEVAGGLDVVQEAK